MLEELKNKIIKEAKKEKTMSQGFKKSGDLIEDYLLKKVPNKWEKLPLDHPTGFDFYDKQHNIYIDVKGCRATEFSNNVFVEHTQSDYSGLSNHWKITLKEKTSYALLYFDTSEKGFGKWWVFDWRELKNKITPWNHTVKGGYTATGDIINADAYCVKKGRFNT
jgi:hypothetical protein